MSVPNFDDMNDAFFDVMDDYQDRGIPIDEKSLGYLLDNAFDDKVLYGMTDHWTDGKGLRDRFKLEASFLWAGGLPAPTADEIADAMMKVLVQVWPTKEGHEVH